LAKAARAGGLGDAFAAFAALMTAAQANDWIVTTAAYPSANLQMMAATPTGSGYRPAMNDPMFDL
jgi:hypothetical protein